jgi:spermidine synthase
MMAHTVMCGCKHEPQKVLVVGGGDGGVLRELTKYPYVKQLDICEIDAEVIEVARKYLPETAASYNDPRVNIHIADGSEFIKQFNAEYDAIIVDSTDPGGPGEPLFGVEFYKNMRKALKDGGVIGSQSESPFLLPEVVKSLQDISRQCFEYSAYGMFYVPTYPTGNIGICAGGVGVDPRVSRREPPSGLRYYNQDIHNAAFILPQFVRELLR